MMMLSGLAPAFTLAAKIMQYLGVYGRALTLLRPERRLAFALVAANFALAVFQLAGPVLFGRAADALVQNRSVIFLALLWAGAGFLNVAANIWIARQAGRLAHRHRLAAMSNFVEDTLALSSGFFGENHSARLMKIMLRGTDQLFSLWLSFLREHVLSFFLIIL